MKYFFVFVLLCFFSPLLFAQQADTGKLFVDSIVLKSTKTKIKKETDTIKTHSPRKATIRSAILPGWGQAYNKKYWKIPIVYGVLGTAAGFFVYNNREYISARDAYRNMMDGDASNNNLIDPKFRPVDPEGVRQYRNGVRQNVDYSVLAFLILWGLNVVDATVDGHLKAFEVSENLSLNVHPTYIPQTRQTTIGLVLTLGKNRNSLSR